METEQQKNAPTEELGRTVVVQTKEGEKYTLKEKIISMSQYVKDILEEEDEGEESPIPIHNVEAKVFDKVLEYCNEHWNNPADPIEKPLRGDIEDVVDSFDSQFIKSMDMNLLLDVLMAANYLIIKDLLDLCCATLASRIKGKSVQELRDLFGVENDFTEEEEKTILSSFAWCEELPQ